MLNLGQLWLMTLLTPYGAYTTFQKLPIYRVKSTYQGANFATFSTYVPQELVICNYRTPNIWATL